MLLCLWNLLKVIKLAWVVLKGAYYQAKFERSHCLREKPTLKFLPDVDSHSLIAGWTFITTHLASPHLSLNREGRRGTTDDFTSSFPHFSLFSTVLWNLVNSRPVHSLMLSSHLFFCLPCFLLPFFVPCKMVLARPDEQETCPYHCSLHLLMMVRSLCGPIACWILAQTSLLVTWFLHEMLSVLR